MVPIASSAQSSHSGTSSVAPLRVVRRRNRVPLSCGPCRFRKLKCDRTNPCQNCVKREEATNCVYAAPASLKRSNQARARTALTSPDDMQNRIDRLEGLVLSLMTNASQSVGARAATATFLSTTGSGSSGGLPMDGDADEAQMLGEGDEEGERDDSDTEKVTKSFGIMKVDAENKKTVYYGEGHWAAILGDIAEVRNYFVTHRHQMEEHMHRVERAKKDMNEDPGPALLFGASKPRPRSEILSQLPSKYLADILITRYFNCFDPATHVLHGPVFQRQYNAHWDDPSKTSIVWIAMLFVMLRIALLSYAQDDNEPPEFAGKSLDLSNTYRTAVADCLIRADYTKPHEHIIETLIFHLHAEYRRNRDSEASVWVLVAMIVRLAMRMGYHQDSKMFGGITPFQGEMRRRVWAFVRQADLLFSFQMSLPAMIRIGDSDTDLPRNIYDEDFDEDSPVLPLARPASEPTTVSYLITKARLAFGFGRVLEEMNGVRSKPYEEILKIDQGLREIYEAVPDHLKLRPLREQAHIPVSHIVARFHLAALYHKSQCVLHRRFLRLARNNPKYVYSRRTCLKSAMALMDFQSSMHRETGDRSPSRNKGYWLTSLTAHDFLLAATVISMDLYLGKQRADAKAASAAASPPTNSSDSNSGRSCSIGEAYGYSAGMEHSADDLLRALEESRDIWTGLRDVSIEAYKASEILNLLIVQLKVPSHSAHGMNDHQPVAGSNVIYVPGQVDEQQNAAMTLGLLSSGGKTPNSGIPGPPAQGQRAPGGVLENTSSLHGMLQTDGVSSVPNGGLFENQIATNGPDPFLSMFGASVPDVGGGMNIDWDAFDSYIQSSNMSLDPAHSLWSSLSPASNSFPPTMCLTNDVPSNPTAGSSPTVYPSHNVPSHGSNSNSPSVANSVEKYNVPLDPLTQESRPFKDGSPGQDLTGLSPPQPRCYAYTAIPTLH